MHMHLHANGRNSWGRRVRQNLELDTLIQIVPRFSKKNTAQSSLKHAVSSKKNNFFLGRSPVHSPDPSPLLAPTKPSGSATALHNSSRIYVDVSNVVVSSLSGDRVVVRAETAAATATVCNHCSHIYIHFSLPHQTNRITLFNKLTKTRMVKVIRHTAVCITAARGRFDRIRQAAPICTPYPDRHPHGTALPLPSRFEYIDCWTCPGVSWSGPGPLHSQNCPFTCGDLDPI